MTRGDVHRRCLARASSDCQYIFRAVRVNTGVGVILHVPPGSLSIEARPILARGGTCVKRVPNASRMPPWTPSPTPPWTPARGQLPLPESESRMCSSRLSAGGGPRLARVTIQLRHYVYLRNLHCLVIQRCTCSTMSEIRNTLGFTCSNCLETWTPCGMHVESGNPAD